MPAQASPSGRPAVRRQRRARGCVAGVCQRKGDSRLPFVARPYRRRATYPRDKWCCRVSSSPASESSAPSGSGATPSSSPSQDGKSGISPVESFDASALGRGLAGEVKDFEPARPPDGRRAAPHRAGARRWRSAPRAWPSTDAGLERRDGRRPAHRGRPRHDDGRGAASSPTSNAWIKRGRRRRAARRSSRKYGSTLLPIHVARAIGAQGMVLTLPAACAAGNYAIGFAADLIRAGRADVVVTGAAELLQELQFSGFVRLAAMAPGEVPALRSEPPGPPPRRGRGPARARERGPRQRARRAPAGRGRRLRPLVRRLPHHAPAPRGRRQHHRHAPGHRALRPHADRRRLRERARHRHPRTTTPPRPRSCATSSATAASPSPA